MNKEKILQLLRTYKREALNPRNDGWVQAHYREELRFVSDETLKLLDEIEERKKISVKNSKSQKFVGVIDDGC
tara:strand:- start:595 stop:813 length:219 start_codon:yes stop_codon:yes gene_type:complete